MLGNGDIWEAGDALAMMDETGADGVVVGRGCLGRPWLFRDLADAFSFRELARSRPELVEGLKEHTVALPTLGEVARMVRRHAELLAGLSATSAAA